MRSVRSGRGSAAAENAILLPVLLLMVMAIMEGGHIIYDWVVLTNGTREAARYGVVAQRSLFESPSALAGDVQGHAVSWMSGLLNPSVTASNVDVDVAMDSAGKYPASITVTTTYTVTMLTPLVQAIVPSVPLTVSSVMRAES